MAQSVKNLSTMRETWVLSLDQEDPLDKRIATTPVFLPGEFHGQRSLVGYSPWDYKELDTTEWLTHTHTHTHTHIRTHRIKGVEDVEIGPLWFLSFVPHGRCLLRSHHKTLVSEEHVLENVVKNWHFSKRVVSKLWNNLEIYIETI